MSKSAFFDTIRPKFPKGKLTADQVAGLEYLIVALQTLPMAQQAYLLATVCIETAWTMQPITEYGKRSYFDKYDTGELAKVLGNTPAKDGDGYKYRGRGYVQITGVANYAKASRKLNVPLLAAPDLALERKVAAAIMILGATEGWFTGHKLGDYITEDHTDFRNARRVINGVDRAEEIAALAASFFVALKAFYKRPAPKPSIPVLDYRGPKTDPKTPPSHSIALLIVAVITVAVTAFL